MWHKLTPSALLFESPCPQLAQSDPSKLHMLYTVIKMYARKLRGLKVYLKVKHFCSGSLQHKPQEPAIFSLLGPKNRSQQIEHGEEVLQKKLSFFPPSLSPPPFNTVHES